MDASPRLQLALDLMNGKRALQMAREALEGGVDMLEAGTPLIKSEGISIVKSLKKEFPGVPVVADMKTMDVGSFEVEIAGKAGADYVCVLAVADDDTIAEAVLAGNQYGCAVIADLINSERPVERAKRAEELGAAGICVHVGIDAQMRGASPVEVLKEVVDAVSVPVWAAGGINESSAPSIVEAGASVVIVGGGIIKAEDVTAAARRVKSAITTGVAKNALIRKYGRDEVRKALERVSTPNISDAMHRKGAMTDILPRGKSGLKMVGPAVTVLSMDGDWAKPVEAIDRASPGDVIVIDAGSGHTAVWGELASHSCKVKGIAGVVIDGAARDIDTIRDVAFPVFSRHVAPNAGEPKGHGEIGVEVVVGNQRVRPGDWVVGDDSGVVVIPREELTEVANRAVDVMEREARLREEINRGDTLSKVMELERWERVG